MTGIEPGSTGIGIDLAINCATTTALNDLLQSKIYEGSNNANDSWLRKEFKFSVVGEWSASVPLNRLVVGSNHALTTFKRQC